MSSLLHKDITTIFDHYPKNQAKDYYIYALADAAQDKSFLKKWSHLPQRNLLAEAAGEKAEQVSPHLIQLNTYKESNEWQYIHKSIIQTPKMTLIMTSLSFEELYAHLRQFLNVKFEGGLEMFLAFWDPIILATLIGHTEDLTLYVQEQVLNNEQKKILLDPIYLWWYWDRLGYLQQIKGRDHHAVKMSYDWRNPFSFSVKQEELMIEATFPDHLIYYLKLNHPFLIQGFNKWELYQYVINQIGNARSYHLAGTRDILNFICLHLIYKENFDQNQTLQKILNKVKEQQLSMDQAMDELENNAA